MPDRRAQRERGANLIEMALVIWLLLLIAAGILDLGRAYYHYNGLTNASREGARRASRFPYDEPIYVAYVEEGVELEIRNSWPGLANVEYEMTIQRPPSITAGQPITVSVTAPFTPVMTGFVGARFDMERKTAMPIFGFD